MSLRTKPASRFASASLALVLICGAFTLRSEARADWPERTITIIVLFPAGGANDLLGRLLAAELAPTLGQNIVVDNRVGAAGNIGLSAGIRLRKSRMSSTDIQQATAEFSRFWETAAA